MLAAKRNAGAARRADHGGGGRARPGIRHADRHRRAAGTPKEIVDRWHREIVRIVALPDIKERLRKLGFDPIANTPAEFARADQDRRRKWDKVAKDAKIRID